MRSPPWLWPHQHQRLAGTTYFARPAEYCAPTLLTPRAAATHSTPFLFSTPLPFCTASSTSNVQPSSWLAHRTSASPFPGPTATARRVLYINTVNTFNAPANGSLPPPTPLILYSGQQCFRRTRFWPHQHHWTQRRHHSTLFGLHEYCGPDIIYATGISNTNPISLLHQATLHRPIYPNVQPSSRLLTGSSASFPDQRQRRRTRALHQYR